MKLNSPTVDLLIAGFAGAAVIMLTARYSGTGISPDSVQYAESGRAFLKTGIFTSVDAGPLTSFPVFYPFFLATGSALCDTSPYILGKYINALLFFLAIVSSGKISLRMRTLTFTRAVLLSVAFSYPLIRLYSMLWSETLLILETLIFFILYDRYTRNYSGKLLLLLAFSAGLAGITRYAGVTLILTGTLAIILDRNRPIKKNALAGALFVSVSGLLPLINLCRNFILSTSLTGPREASNTSFYHNITIFGDYISQWFLGPLKPYVNFPMVGTLTIAVVFYGFLHHTYLKRNNTSFRAVIALFFLIYTLFILTAASVLRFDALNTRLLGPIVIPFIILSADALFSLFEKINKIPTKFSYTIIPVILLWNITQFQSAWEWGIAGYTQGVPGFTNSFWQNSHIANYLKAKKYPFDPAIPCYSNANELAFLVTNKYCFLLPHLLYNNEKRKLNETGSFYLIWFDNLKNNELINLKEVTVGRKIEKKINLDDGMILLIKY